MKYPPGGRTQRHTLESELPRYLHYKCRSRSTYPSAPTHNSQECEYEDGYDRRPSLRRSSKVSAGRPQNNYRRRSDPLSAHEQQQESRYMTTDSILLQQACENIQRPASEIVKFQTFAEKQVDDSARQAGDFDESSGNKQVRHNTAARRGSDSRDRRLAGNGRDSDTRYEISQERQKMVSSTRISNLLLNTSR
ncbi:hypothetical protein EJ05DRAFT_133442 [Pseudovirgaria hyperparasitica]|uniref:Uncharacterized protein n=1 Tax=Pseudovirgaria hyperparasitica TaxID=470096 RepID=A0A6A6VX90_9PEZI|nr:uncharacterized protein EJ05DRAFT_133442 [Pseudovirgaria hyperparasitica]KAF2754795.1 hypothetical protein EJ05DRAFT_133442 [Pseudovirgaria hyperparasitica]